MIFAALCVLCGGCEPSYREIAKVVETIPLGASRDEVRTVLVAAYGKKYPPQKYGYAMDEAPRRIGESKIQATFRDVEGSKKRGEFAVVYPPNLFTSILKPDASFADVIGLGAEGSHGNGFLDIYYDTRMNYVGYATAASW